MEFKCNKLYKIHSNLLVSTYVTKTHDYIQYIAVWQAHVFVFNRLF